MQTAKEPECIESTPEFFDILKIEDSVIGDRNKISKPKPTVTVDVDYQSEKSSRNSSSGSEYDEYSPRVKKRRRPNFKKEDCEYCHFVGLTGGGITNHLKKHLMSIVTCKHCNSKFLLEYELEKHMDKEHKDILVFGCQLCDRKFHSNNELQDHSKHCLAIKVKHFNCLECEFFTKSEQNLNTHYSHHGSEELFKCSHCSYAARLNIMLELHSYVHSYKLQKKKKFECGYCDESFDDTSSLKNHHVSHKNDKNYFNCEICPFKCVALA